MTPLSAPGDENVYTSFIRQEPDLDGLAHSLFRDHLDAARREKGAESGYAYSLFRVGLRENAKLRCLAKESFRVPTGR